MGWKRDELGEGWVGRGWVGSGMSWERYGLEEG